MFKADHMTALTSSRPTPDRMKQQLIARINAIGVCAIGTTQVRVLAIKLKPNVGIQATTNTQAHELLQTGFVNNKDTVALLGRLGNSVITLITGAREA